MRHDSIRDIVLIPAATEVGWIGWCGHVPLLSAAIGFPALWSMATFIFAAYFLTASRGLPRDIAAFYGTDLSPGLVLWLVASSAFVLIYAVLWAPIRKWRKLLRYLVAACLMAVPPFGILGRAQPLTAAGVLFPGWAGLASTSWQPGWYDVDQKCGTSLGRDTSLRSHKVHAATVLASRGNPSSVVVLPESALGFWTPTIEWLWADQLRESGMTVIAGAAVVNPDGYDNVLVVGQYTRNQEKADKASDFADLFNRSYQALTKPLGEKSPWKLGP